MFSYYFFAQNSEKKLDTFVFRLYTALSFLLLTYLFMTKQDLVAAVAAAAGVSKRVAGDALEAVLDSVTKELKKGKNVTITGFGTFRISKRAARTGVNPRNPSQKIKIPAMNVPAFKAGKSLKDAAR